MNGVSIRGIKINDTSACCMRVVRLSKHTISIGISTTVVLIKGGGGKLFHYQNENSIENWRGQMSRRGLFSLTE